MSTSQIIAEAIIILLILIMFFGLLNMLYELYFLSKKSSLTANEKRTRNILKLLVLIPALLLFITIFIGLIVLYTFIHQYDLMDVLQLKYIEINDRLQRIESLMGPVFAIQQKLQGWKKPWFGYGQNETEIVDEYKPVMTKEVEKPRSSFWSRTKKLFHGKNKPLNTLDTTLEPLESLTDINGINRESKRKSKPKEIIDETGLNY